MKINFKNSAYKPCYSLFESIRCAPQYILKLPPRTKPNKVIPKSFAKVTAKLEGAPTAAMIGTPARNPF